MGAQDLTWTLDHIRQHIANRLPLGSLFNIGGIEASFLRPAPTPKLTALAAARRAGRRMSGAELRGTDPAGGRLVSHPSTASLAQAGQASGRQPPWHVYCVTLARCVQPVRSAAETMTLTATALPAASRAVRAVARPPALTGGQWFGLLLLLPAAGFLLAFFIVPAVTLFGYSVLTQRPDGVVTLPLTLAHFRHFLGTELYTHVLWSTLRMAAITAALAALLGYPVALVMVRSNALVMRIMTIVVIAPLIVSVVVRTYGWQLLLANSRTGVVNWMLLSLGIVHQPIRILYSETAVIIGSLHVFLPMMVLPLASALAKINPQLQDAARTLGAPAWRVFGRVTLPLSLPGLAVGFTLVFSLTASSYVTPAILGGTSAQMLGNLIEQQITAVYDWPFGAAVAVVLVATVLGINLTSTWFFERRRNAMDAA